MKKNNKPAAKRYMKTVGMVMASVMVLSSTTGQMVYAESAKDQKDTQDGEKKEEKTIVYLNGKTGNDKNSGESQDEAVKSFEKAAELAGSSGVIRICGTITVDEEETWELPSGVSIRRAEDFEDALVRVTGCLKLDNVRLYTEDITGDGEVEGAAEKEKTLDNDRTAYCGRGRHSGGRKSFNRFGKRGCRQAIGIRADYKPYRGGAGH